jgi:hypothetical protein
MCGFRDSRSAAGDSRYISAHMTRARDRERANGSRGVGWRLAAALLTLGLMTPGAVTRTAHADEDPCGGFSGNVTPERALFAGAAQPATAARDVASAPLLLPGRLYQLQLTPQGQVSMRLAPGKKTQVDGAFAGLVRLQLLQAGNYRISMDQGAWIDVVADGQMINSSNFQSRPGCTAPHKIVQFLLPAGHELLLQFSAATAPVLRVAITPVE